MTFIFLSNEWKKNSFIFVWHEMKMHADQARTFAISSKVTHIKKTSPLITQRRSEKKNEKEMNKIAFPRTFYLRFFFCVPIFLSQVIFPVLLLYFSVHLPCLATFQIVENLCTCQPMCSRELRRHLNHCKFDK